MRELICPQCGEPMTLMAKSVFGYCYICADRMEKEGGKIRAQAQGKEGKA